MIAADTSSLSSFLCGDEGKDVELIASIARTGELVLPPVVVTEILSATDSGRLAASLNPLTLLELGENYWARAGATRRLLRQKGFKAKIADALIAQSCIDHDVALITRDADFRYFAKHCGLKLA